MQSESQHRGLEEGMGLGWQGDQHHCPDARG